MGRPFNFWWGIMTGGMTIEDCVADKNLSRFPVSKKFLSNVGEGGDRKFGRLPDFKKFDNMVWTFTPGVQTSYIITRWVCERIIY